MSKEIRAGKAYVELSVKDRLLKGLKAATQKMFSFGATVAKISAAVGAAAAAGAAIAMKTFSDMGSEMADAAGRTGMSVEALSELKYAAEQSGASLEAVETGAKKMSKTIYDAANGSQSASDALAALGLSAEQLRSMRPENQFSTIASRLGAIEDATTRAALAQEIFGRSGTALLPMIADFDTLTQRARDLGLVMSTEDAAAADRFGDLLGDLWKTLKMGVFTIGAGLEPALRSLVEWMTTASAATGKWLTENRGGITALANVVGSVLGWIRDRIADVGKSIYDIFGGAIDALAGGQFKVAGELAVGELKIVWIEFKDWAGDVFESIADMFSKAMMRATAEGKETWIRFKDWFSSLTNSIGNDVVRIGKQMQYNRQFKKVWAMDANDPEYAKEWAKLKELDQQVKDTFRQGQLGAKLSDEAEEAIDAINKQLDADLGAYDKKAAEREGTENAQHDQRVAGLQRELDEKRRTAAIDRVLNKFFAGVETDRAPGPTPPVVPELPEVPKLPDEEEIATMVAASVFSSRGTFNAAALESLEGGRGGALDKVANNTAKTAQNTDKLVKAASNWTLRYQM